MEKGKVTGVRFLRVNRLIDDLRRERVDQLLSYKYLLGLMIVHNVAMVSGSGPRDSLVYLLIWWAVIIALTFLELRLCYTANKAGDNRDFLKRYVAISFVVELIMGLVALAGSMASVFLVSLMLTQITADFEIPNVWVVVGVALAIGLTIRAITIAWKVNCFSKVSKPLTVS